MDTSTFCNSTSTSALVKLGLCLLDRCSLSALTWLAFELHLRGFGRFRLHTSLRLRALIRSWRGVYVCKSRCTRTRFQFKKPHSGEHSWEHFGCVWMHFQAFMNLAEICFLLWFPKSVRNISEETPENVREWGPLLTCVLTSLMFCRNSLTPAWTCRKLSKTTWPD